MPPTVADPRNLVIGAHCWVLFGGQKIISATAFALRLGITMANTTFAGTMREMQYPTGYNYTLELTRNVLREGDVDVSDQIMAAFAGEKEGGVTLPVFTFVAVRHSGGVRREYQLHDCYPMGDIDILSMRGTAAVEQSLRFAVNGELIVK